MRRSFLFAGLVILSLVVFVPGSVLACSIEADCCSASVQPCADDETCTCSFSCGPDEASCSCECIAGGETFGTPDLLLALSLNAPFGLSAGNGSANDLDTFFRHLESVINWNIDVDSNVASLVIPDGSWNGGALDLTLQAFAADAGVAISFDESTTTMRVTAR